MLELCPTVLPIYYILDNLLDCFVWKLFFQSPINILSIDFFALKELGD